MSQGLAGLKVQFKNNFRNYRGLLHLLFWVVFIACYYIQYKPNLSTTVTYPADFMRYFIVTRVAALIFLSYTFLFFIVPLSSRKSQLRFWLCLVLAITFWFMLGELGFKAVLMGFPELNKLPINSMSQMIYRHWGPFLFTFSFFIAFYYFVDIYDQQKKVQRLASFKTQKIALESSFLKSQINPHFLFNTFNNIFALSLKKSPQTAVIIERLESLLHYMLYECKEDLVPLKNEFTFTNSYIDLEKLRHSADRCEVTVNISGDPKGILIAPLLLINFLENAFKHGTKTTFGKSWIDMNIQVESKAMRFILKNSKPSSPAMFQGISEYKGGIGLKNVKRRLEILYPKKHTLTIEDTPEYFGVYLYLIF